MSTDGTGFHTCKDCHKTESLWNHTTTDHKEGEQLEDRRSVGASRWNCGDGTDQRCLWWWWWWWWYMYKGKVIPSPYRPGVVQRVCRGITLPFHDRGTRRGEWSAARPGRSLPPWKTRYPFYRRLDGPQGRSGRAENLVPTGIRSPDRPTRKIVAILTELTGPHTYICVCV